MAESLQTNSAIQQSAAAAQCTCGHAGNSITIPIELWQRIVRMLAQMRGQFVATEKELNRLVVEKKS